MNKDDIISDEQLNAFADSELDTEEENRILNLSEDSPELSNRMCEQRRLKEMVRHAYREVPQPRHRFERKGQGNRLFATAAAAVILLAAGGVAGWFGSNSLNATPDSVRVAGAPNQVVPAEPEPYLLHVTSGDPQRMQVALQRVEQLLNSADGNQAHRVEVIANEAGLDLLRSDVTPFGDQIRALYEQDVLFFACTKAIERLEEQGIQVTLVPEANTHYSALDRVVLRMNEGWSYEKI
jgi:intracellular sulfur oxidation DsrE/DsrF family protein